MQKEIWFVLFSTTLSTLSGMIFAIYSPMHLSFAQLAASIPESQCDSSIQTCPEATTESQCDSSIQTCPEATTESQCDPSIQTCPEATTESQCDITRNQNL